MLRDDIRFLMPYICASINYSGKQKWEDVYSHCLAHHDGINLNKFAQALSELIKLSAIKIDGDLLKEGDVRTFLNYSREYINFISLVDGEIPTHPFTSKEVISLLNVKEINGIQVPTNLINLKRQFDPACTDEQINEYISLLENLYKTTLTGGAK